ncbi:hypothetical protein [Paenibacillus glycanilyticus]|uniref:hypothetical protein n=1 Tax=Paenibacillus glycanilyticus TaxID=126569 RepID=UPI001910F4B0|nr:hypothetical protein [Paenibacillus glycanilyticus]
MSTIAIIGSRHYPKLRLVEEYVNSLSDDTIVISRGSRGVDHVAYVTAHFRGLHCRRCPAEWNVNGNSSIYLSNLQIVKDAEFLVVFWDGESKGTLQTLEIAYQHQKPVIVYGPNVEILEKNALNSLEMIQFPHSDS